MKEDQIVKVKEYFGYKVEIIKVEETYFPYMFKIHWNNKQVSNFAGIPNKCYSIRAALKRAWYRCKLKREGKYPYKILTSIKRK